MSEVFGATYRDARMRFLAAGAYAGAAEMRSWRNPLRGPNNEPLGTDAAWFGPRAAKKVLVTLSATHGVEGFTGSALQTDWVQRKGQAGLPEDVAALHIHALNPHGFAWLRRVTEEGIDLNRNFVDFSKPLPENPGYTELHDALIAADERTVAAYRDKHGERALEIAVSGGQHTHADGLFYGGRAPSWSCRTVEAIIDAFDLRSRETVAVIDIHTGLGDFGAGEVICDHPTGSPELARAKRWYGAVTEPALGTSSSVPKTGLIDYGWMNALGAAVTFVTLEFGTYPVEAMFRALREDQLLHLGGAPDWTDDAVRVAKARLKQHFCPDDPAWRDAVLARGRAVLANAITGLI